MADWERLTPDHIHGAPITYRRTRKRRKKHTLRLGQSTMCRLNLSDAELDALATKSEKVRALALIARECLALMRLRMAQDEGLGRDRVMERACDVLESTLAPFEATDA